MTLLTLYITLCTASGCTAYEAKHNLTSDQCDQYFTDSGLLLVEEKISYYVNDFDAPNVEIRSIHCESENNQLIAVK